MMLYPGRSSHRRRLLLFALLSIVLLSPAGTRRVAAHPLGNFTINLYSRLTIAPARVNIAYFVDMAEIPTFQEFGSATPDAQQQQAWLTRTVATLRGGLKLQVDGKIQELRSTAQNITFLTGQGGLVTTRLELQFAADLSALANGTERSIDYEDTNYDGRLGWHEIVVLPDTGIRLVKSSAPTQDRSHELRVYPQDMLTSPLDVRTATISVIPGASTVTGAPGQETALAARTTDRFAALITTESLSPLVQLLSLLLALGLGAVHALAPGHGKTIVGAYLVGARGTGRHALFLGLTVTITHTIGVFVLGLITLYASRYILPEQLYPWLGVVSGALVALMGFTLLIRRIRVVRARMVTTYDPGHLSDHDHLTPHTHDGDFGFGHEHGPNTHTHVMPGADGAPLTWRNLLALGVSGGLIPCPSALLVMLSAISLHRVAFGLVLIVVFSIGLAGVLTGIGLLFVYSVRWLSHLSIGRARQLGIGFRLLPIASALLVTTVGLAITGGAIVQAGLLR